MTYRGKSLRALRESKQIKLRRISNETRISLSYLEDLEKERFDRFPGEFYFKSFTKAYARSLGLDPNEVLCDLTVAYEAWSGATPEGDVAGAGRESDEGLFNRISGYIRGVQEV